MKQTDKDPVTAEDFNKGEKDKADLPIPGAIPGEPSEPRPVPPAPLGDEAPVEDEGPVLYKVNGVLVNAFGERV